MDITRYRTRLLDERSRLVDAQAVLTDQQGTSVGGHRVVDVDDAAPQDPAETGEQLIERGEVLDGLAALDAELAEIDAALARIDADTFGRCEDCEQPIADDRLDALPTARRCAVDQQRHESGVGGLSRP